MDISVISVTYNSETCIADCIKSVLSQRGVEFEVVVVDNASTDNTLSRLKELKSRVIASTENVGFGRGNNLGFAATCGRYVFLLNPDARLVEADALANLCRLMDANPRWGMAGTMVRFPDGKPESPPATIYSGQRHVQRDFSKLPGKIAWVLGASMIIRRELYEKLDGFDPGFFLFSEEMDFCLRMREIGFEIGYIPEVVVEHIGGASKDARDPYEVSGRKLKGLLHFRQKHYSLDDCVWLAKRDLRRARFRMILNGLLARLQPPYSKAWQKHRLYRAIWEVSRDYLESRKTPQV
ncbi:MAG: glycosyltransferase family 2 protein [Verrucomicrobiota bacterium]|jgi:GT2 family glycosyltransferase